MTDTTDWDQDINIDAASGKELTLLVEEGTYVAIIREMFAPTTTKSTGTYFMRVSLEVDGRRMFTYLTGPISLLNMIWQKRQHYLGDQVMVVVTHRLFQDKIYCAVRLKHG